MILLYTVYCIHYIKSIELERNFLSSSMVKTEHIYIITLGLPEAPQNIELFNLAAIASHYYVSYHLEITSYLNVIMYIY